ncbi:peptidoglycan editing factor PgeF [Limnobacter parvus]|uniref:Purine nucleoside phosphorylase n=1 Tax=Limnobacter parvus TaxID=2939690 RepID=A0ABT1XJT0_9BURK|nr:peptidoglycan editing factor PgeF [Limnobacter parvus]MCR2747548.1 peptidoglycan editing factor PgeF [Limnobacter parvus]
MRLNKVIPVSRLGPQWAGVKVLVTEAGFQQGNFQQTAYGFNLGVHVGDEPSEVEARRAAVQAEMGAPIVWLNQVHGCDVFKANDLPDSTPPQADASITTFDHTTLAIMTADCLPVVFAAINASGKVLGVGAAHAGWRGLHAGVLQATANALADSCAVPAGQVKAWMGPAIGPESFEVGQDVLDAFVQQNPSNAACFKADQTKDKYLANIYALARIALNNVGIVNVEGGDLDTLTDSRWFSHRRGQHQGVPSGRFATLIRLLPSQVA